jgi:hypothetical protein
MDLLTVKSHKGITDWKFKLGLICVVRGKLERKSAHLRGVNSNCGKIAGFYKKFNRPRPTCWQRQFDWISDDVNVGPMI